MGWEDTWLVQVPSDLIARFGPWLPVIAIVVAAVIAMLGSVRYIARGGGQYGIIEGYVGMIGAGKTTLATQHALTLARARDAVLLSNIGVRCGPKCMDDPVRLLPIQQHRTLTDRSYHTIEHGLLPVGDRGLDLNDLMRRGFALRAEGRGLVLLMDEVGVIMPARLWKEFPVALMWLLQQSRRLACEWVWTAQDPSFVDHQLRSLTAVVHYVRSYPPPSIWRRVKGKRPWLLIASAFTPTNAPRANGETTARAMEKRIGRRIVRYRRAFELAFDTDEIVLPSRKFQGAAELVDAVEAARGSVPIAVAVNDMGPVAQVSLPSATAENIEGG